MGGGFLGVGWSFPIEFSVLGSDWDALVVAARELVERLAASGVVVDVDSDYRLGTPSCRSSRTGPWRPTCASRSTRSPRA